MENRGSIQQTESERRCQIEGCNDVTVGARTSLCRKHRNNKYKQNYKKRKRKAQGVEENQGESLESQLAVEKYHLEQKYASMLQQVLVQKRLELLQSPSIRSLLRIHQQTVRENKQKELMEKRKTAHNERSSKLQQEKQSKLQSTSEPSSSCANTNTTCNSGATTKSTSSPSKAASSNKTLSKSSKQSSRPSQGRNVSKNSKHRNNSNSSIESSVNGLASNLKIASSNNNNSIGHPVYGSTGAWATEKSEFCDLRHVQNFQQQQMTSQEILHHPIQQALQQQNLQQQPQPPPPPPPPPQQQQRQVSNSLQPELLLQLYQQHNMQKQQLQHLQRPNLLEHLHQKQLHERQEKEKQQQLQLQQQQRLSEQLVQQQQQQQQFVQQQRRLQQQQQQHQQQQQQELRLQLQNSRQQQQQQYKHQQMQQQQQQQQQQLQHQKGTGHQTRHQVQLPQQQQQHQHLLQQHQTCASSVTQSVNHVSSTEILFQNLPSIQSSISNLLVSQSHINTSNHDVNSSAAISTTTRHSVLPRTILTNTQGRTQNCTPINHMVSNTPSVTSHRPIAPRLEGHPNVNNTLCNAGMPIITAIISAPLTQQIMPQNASNVERNSIQPGTESNVLTSINSFGNPLTNHYPLMPFNTQMDMNLLQ